MCGMYSSQYWTCSHVLNHGVKFCLFVFLWLPVLFWNGHVFVRFWFSYFFLASTFVCLRGFNTWSVEGAVKKTFSWPTPLKAEQDKYRYRGLTLANVLLSYPGRTHKIIVRLKYASDCLCKTLGLWLWCVMILNVTFNGGKCASNISLWLASPP